MTIEAPKVGATVFWTPPAALPPALAGKFGPPPLEAMPAEVHHAHTERLVDLFVKETEESEPVYLRFVPFLHTGDPDPGSPLGCCHSEREHQSVDLAAQHEIMEGKRPPNPTRGPDGEVIQPGSIDAG